MLRKSSVWLVVLISFVAIAFIASGCAKKQVIKEEAVAKPVVESKAAPVEKPKGEAKAAPGAVPGEEVKVYSPKEGAAAPMEAPTEEGKVPEVAPPEAGFKEEAKGEAQEEAKVVPSEEVKTYAPKEEAALPKEQFKEEAKPPEVAPPEAGFKEKEEAAKEEAAKEEAKISSEEVKTYAPKEEAVAPKEGAKEEAQVPEIAPKGEAKIERKAAARPEEKFSPFDLAGLRIQFGFDDYNLSSQARENLEKVASWMSKNPAAKIQIQGNTCNIGTSEYNLALGENRAMSARKYLQGLGVSSSRLSTISYGMEKPMLPNTNENNRSKNRRDEFVLTK